ncbi:hypothetical protein AB0B28_17930 [Glycomyces sp. NPDC046736]|uniref:hypothetical protein n=1 Tax=Glycomyces sp. NPDC046736 TaxID=3155615 RepID=UPI0033CC5AD0
MSRFKVRAEGWEARAHPLAQHRVFAGGAAHPGPDRSVLRLRLGKVGEGRPSSNSSKPDTWVHPGTPVVLVDGTPCVQGYGAIDVELPLGPHDVEVQAGGSRGWWRVESAPNAVTELDFVNDLYQDRASGRRWYFGPAVKRHSRRLMRSSRHDQPWLPLATDPPLEVAASLAPMGPSRPEVPAGFGLLVLDLRWEFVWQRLAHPEGTGQAQMRHYGEPQPSKHRPWLEAPTLVVDDVEVEARWARLCVPVRPGAHVVDLAVPDGSSADHGFATLQETVEVAAGRIQRSTVTAEVVQVHDGEDYRLYVMELSCESHRPAKALPAYPDKRPPLRRMDGEDRPHRAYSIA